MARLNSRPSATPQPTYTRASTIDSLYRDPSVAPRASRARNSAYSAINPSQSFNSDKENETPGARQNGTKRRRTDAYSTSQEEEDDDDDNDNDNVEQDVDQDDELPMQPIVEEEEGDQRFYNPNQDPEKRRRLRATMRDHQRMVQENRDELIKDNHSLYDALRKQDNLFGKVRQTADATVDSRFLVFASDLAGKKLNNSLNGAAGVGIDYDQFVSKCIYFMKSGGNRTEVPVADDEEEEDDGDALDWAVLGREACFPSNTRPPVSSFLLGPLSVQKRVRATQRRARSQRQPVGPATRPQEVKETDMTQSENSNLSHLVKSIKTRLEDHIKRGTEGVDSELSEIAEDDLNDEDQAAAFRRYRVAPTPQGEAAVGLLDFAINPHDFGQTIENLFYISFLVREGNAQVLKDDDGLPLLVPAVPRSVSDQQAEGAHKHQAVFSIDYPTWQMFIRAYDIADPLIPHRELVEDVVAPGGWYS